MTNKIEAATSFAHQFSDTGINVLKRFIKDVVSLHRQPLDLIRDYDQSGRSKEGTLQAILVTGIPAATFVGFITHGVEVDSALTSTYFGYLGIAIASMATRRDFRHNS